MMGECLNGSPFRETQLSNLTPSKTRMEVTLKWGAVRMRRKRAEETEEERQARRRAAAERMRLKRSLETPAEREARLRASAERMRRKRTMENDSESEAIRYEVEDRMRRCVKVRRELSQNWAAARMRRERARETEAERLARRRLAAERMRLKRAMETPEERGVRLHLAAARMRRRRAEETPEEREVRLRTAAARMREKRSEGTGVVRRTKQQSSSIGMQYFNPNKLELDKQRFQELALPTQYNESLEMLPLVGVNLQLISKRKKNLLGQEAMNSTNLKNSIQTKMRKNSGVRSQMENTEKTPGFQFGNVETSNIRQSVTCSGEDCVASFTGMVCTNCQVTFPYFKPNEQLCYSCCCKSGLVYRFPSH